MSVYLISALLAPAALLSPTCRSASLRVSSGRSAPPAVMAGFGGAAASPSKGKKAGKPAGKAASKAANRAAKSAGLSAKRQWDSHTALVAAGGATFEGLPCNEQCVLDVSPPAAPGAHC